MKLTILTFFLLFFAGFTSSAQLVVSAGADQSICLGESATLTGTFTGQGGADNLIFLWGVLSGDGNSISNNSSATTLVNPTVTTTYVFIVSSNNLSGSDTVTVFVGVPPLPVAGPDTTICGLEFVTSASNSGGLGTWISPTSAFTAANPNQASTTLTFNNSGNFTVIWQVNNNGCVQEDSFTITVLDAPVSVGNTEVQFCSLSGTLNFEELNYPFPVSFSWQNGNLGLNIDNILQLNSNVTALIEGSYPVILLQNATGTGCNVADSLLLSFIDHTPAILLTPSGSKELQICAGERFNLLAFGTGTRRFIPEGSAESIGNSQVVGSRESTGFLIMELNQGFCSSKDSVLVDTFIEAGIPPTIEIDYLCDGVRFLAFNPNLDAAETRWIVGTDTILDASIFERNFNETFTIGLLNREPNGCITFAQTTVNSGNLSENLPTTIPNVFTPNGDGVNDVFLISENLFLSGCGELFIYNRSGNLVFNTSAGNLAWDGFDFTGQRVPTGTYYYVLKLPTGNIKGTVALFR
ncbi:MAG: T9SS type B sorting domain-containing protein [Luteibaculaceae bacterium]